MWLEINTDNFSVKQNGFTLFENADGSEVYSTSSDATIRSVADLKDINQGLAVEIRRTSRNILFGRDYLGQFPLLYIYHNNFLFLSDDFLEVDQWVRQNQIELTYNEQAFALYYTMGFVPQGMTLFNEIIACENVSYYQWQHGSIKRHSTFESVDINPSATIDDVGECIEQEVKQIAAKNSEIDVWCSGGIDSSIMAYCFNSHGRKADILTLGYGDEIVPKFGDGEIQFAKLMADTCDTNIRYAKIDTPSYMEIFSDFLEGHTSPVIDTCAPPKYALAKFSRGAAITGEGGDPVFGGVKNNTVTYVHANAPNIPLGWVYANAHSRFVDLLDKIFKNGAQLKEYVTDYFEQQFARYDGELIRKLFYLNTLLKQGSMIFPQSYTPQTRYKTKIYHPLTNLSVYRTAFSLRDELRYQYPQGKIVLKELFGKRLPKQIVDRQKSGTLVPLREYINYFPEKYFTLDAISNTGYFNETFIEDKSSRPKGEDLHLIAYGTFTLNMWLNNRRGNNNDEHVSLKTGCM
jgi:asparagine synthetase B (glutamine-hydrolysing)